MPALSDEALGDLSAWEARIRDAAGDAGAHHFIGAFLTWKSYVVESVDGGLMLRTQDKEYQAHIRWLENYANGGC